MQQPHLSPCCPREVSLDSLAQLQDLGDRKTVEKQPQDSRTIEYTDKHQARKRLQQGERR